jgi:peptide chain release factor subunit 1
MTVDLLSPPAHSALDDPALDALLERLLAIQPGRHRVVSCYLRLGPDERAHGHYLTTLKNRIRAVQDEAASADLSRVLAYVASARTLPPSQGLALFACEALDLFEAVPLPRVHRTRVVVDDTPRVVELMSVRQELGTLLVAVFDRSHARFFLAGLGSATELDCLTEPSHRGGVFRPDRSDAPGWGERDYHQRLREERHRHYAAIADHLRHLMLARPIRGIVLAGPHKEVAALTRFLPRDLASRVLGSAALNPTAASTAEVRTAALAVAGEHERAAELALVSSLAESIGSGWAVEGAHEVLRALARGQVRTLVVRADFEMAGFRCATTGRLALSRGECRNEGAPAPVQDVVDEAVEDALRQSADVIVVHDRSSADSIDGLVALLRFR